MEAKDEQDRATRHQAVNNGVKYNKIYSPPAAKMKKIWYVNIELKALKKAGTETQTEAERGYNILDTISELIPLQVGGPAQYIGFFEKKFGTSEFFGVKNSQAGQTVAVLNVPKSLKPRR